MKASRQRAPGGASASHDRVVVRLIEKAAGLAVGKQVGLQAVLAQPVHHLGRAFAGDDLAHARQALEVARRSVVARHHQAHIEKSFQKSRQRRPGCIHGHGRGLHDRGIGIAVDEETGQAIGFTVNHAQGIAIEPEPLAPGKRRRETLGHQSQQFRQGSAFDSSIEDAQSNRGQGGPGGAGQGSSPFIEHGHQRRSAAACISRRSGEHVLAKDPGVPGHDAGAAARIHDDGGYSWLAHDGYRSSLAWAASIRARAQIGQHARDGRARSARGGQGGLPVPKPLSGER